MSMLLDEKTKNVFETSEDSGKSSHIILIPPELKGKTTPQALVLKARIEGFPITALCGYTWIPQQNPENFPVCSKCLAIYQMDGDHREERDELPEI